MATDTDLHAAKGHEAASTSLVMTSKKMKMSRKIMPKTTMKMNVTNMVKYLAKKMSRVSVNPAQGAV